MPKPAATAERPLTASSAPAPPRRRVRPRRWGWLALLLFAPLSMAQGLSLHYQERPPYSQTAADGSVSGLVATPAAAALQRAGLSFTWVRTPSQRQLALIQGGNGLHCGVGWFRNPDRAALGKFSRELYRDLPFGALVRRDAPLADRMSAAAAMAAASAQLLLKDGYSYGALFDELIARAHKPPQRTSSEVPQMVRMLAAGRAEWMILAPEEAQLLLALPEATSAGLRLIGFAEMPAGPGRHLYCNPAVPDDWIARIDRALAAGAPR